ncbi:hypothetical protein ACFW9O_24985 [Streptomyces sp. NPDC059499]|uniref:hypothetical protein n=1 Tax=Streptomyces sp. NPDC059499 TaxID=3346852 RepID=UPI0036C0E8F3
MTQSIHVRGEGGQVIKMDLPLPDPIAERLTKGYLRRVNADGSPYSGSSPTPTPSAPDTGNSALTNGVPPRPGKNATKAEWVGWAVNAHGLEPDAAEGMTKADLAELPDTPAPDPGTSAPAAGAGGKPSEDDPKSAWIAYVVAQGHLSADDAATFTKADLIDLVK